MPDWGFPNFDRLLDPDYGARSPRRTRRFTACQDCGQEETFWIAQCRRCGSRRVYRGGGLIIRRREYDE